MPEKTRAALGGCQRFECRVIGYPRPTIQWFKDGRNITNDERYEFDYSIDGIITMVICNVTEKDQGVYSCRAENSEGWAATAAFLNVRGKGCVFSMFLLLVFKSEIEKINTPPTPHLFGSMSSTFSFLYHLTSSLFPVFSNIGFKGVRNLCITTAYVYLL